MTRRQIFSWFFFGIFLLLIYLFYMIIEPFILPLFWAGVLALVLYPPYERLTKALKNRAGISSSIMTVLTILVVVLPLSIVVTTLVFEMLDFYQGTKNQIEGGILQAVSVTLKEQVVFDRKEVTSREWSAYPILTFPEAPTVEVVLMDRSDPSLGAGEGSLPPTSAALANAFAHATGRRLRELPMTPERVKALLS